MINQHLTGCLTLFLHRNPIIEHHCSCRTPPPTTGALCWANRLTNAPPAADSQATYRHTIHAHMSTQAGSHHFHPENTHTFYKTSEANTVLDKHKSPICTYSIIHEYIAREHQVTCAKIFTSLDWCEGRISKNSCHHCLAHTKNSLSFSAVFSLSRDCLKK